MDHPLPTRPSAAPSNSTARSAGTSVGSTLGPMIRANRRSAGLTREELASRIGVTEAVVALWEDPEYSCVDLSILSRVAKALGRRLEVRLGVPRAERARQRPAWEDLIAP